MNDRLRDRTNISFEKISEAIDHSFYETKKQYDQSRVGRFHSEMNLWIRFWETFSSALQWLYWKLVWPLSWRLWRAFKWLMTRYRNLWLRITYKKDQYGVMRFSRTRGGVVILSTILSLYLMYGVTMISLSLPWYLLTVKHDEVLYLSNHSAVEGHDRARIKINDVYEITGCESLDCSDQDSVSFRVEASWFNEVWSIVHNHALYYPDYVAAAVSPVVNRCTITSYGVRKKFLVRYWELHPDILQVRCLPVGLEKENSIHNKDYR
jgi:hypothetical protein